MTFLPSQEQAQVLIIFLLINVLIRGIVVFNTPGANANAVKEHVLAALLLASRDILGGIKWVEDNKDDADIAKSAEKAKKAFAGKGNQG